jgi:flagellin
MRINHNISALNAWRSLDQVNSSMGKTLEKLSSGLRINRAGDDAAGLAISEKMRGQIKGLDMAVKNAQDAISLIQTAEGALTETHSILQRMRELADQAASDTNTNVDRNQIQAEIDQLREEIDRIARTTEFNTMKLLDGKIESFRPEADVKVVTGGNFDLQASLKGASAVGSIQVNTGTTLANVTGLTIDNNDSATVTLNLSGLDLGSVTVKLVDTAVTNGAGTIQIIKNGSTITNFAITLSNNSTDVTKSVTLGDLKFDFVISDSITTTGNSSIDIQINSINVSLAEDKVVDYDYEYEFQDAKEGSFVVEVGQFNGAGTSPLDVRVNYFDDTGLATAVVVDFSNGNAVIGDASITAPGATVVSGSLSASTTSGFVVDLTKATASGKGVADQGLVFNWDTGVYDISDFNGALPIEEVIDSGVVRAEQRWYEDTSLVFQIGANEGQNMVAGLDDMRAAALGLTNDSLKVTDQNSAERTIMVIDAAIHKVSSARAKIGAVQNRLEHTISNLGVASENLTAAESRIRDVDMAKEMMEYTKQQILMQSANAMLAQANTIPQNVLQLLR